MTLKAKLKIVLHANDTVVAESDDTGLWQQVLVAINASNSSTIETNPTMLAKPEGKGAGLTLPRGDSVETLAQELKVGAEVLVGACGPTQESPFIHLDKHHWEALKKNTPPRGSNAVGATVLAATLLVLWKECAELGETKMREASAVVNTINVTAKNPTRSINNCEWLQLRNGAVVLNPAQTSKAIQVAQAYCLKKRPDEA